LDAISLQWLRSDFESKISIGDFIFVTKAVNKPRARGVHVVIVKKFTISLLPGFYREFLDWHWWKVVGGHLFVPINEEFIASSRFGWLKKVAIQCEEFFNHSSPATVPK